MIWSGQCPRGWCKVFSRVCLVSEMKIRFVEHPACVHAVPTVRVPIPCYRRIQSLKLDILRQALLVFRSYSSHILYCHWFFFFFFCRLSIYRICFRVAQNGGLTAGSCLCKMYLWPIQMTVCDFRENAFFYINLCAIAFPLLRLINLELICVVFSLYASTIARQPVFRHNAIFIYLELWA